MAIFSYITEKCKKDLKTHGLKQAAENLARRIEEDQNLPPLGVFHSELPILKKNLGRQGRLLIAACNLDSHSVYVFLRLFIRGSEEYDAFRHDVILGNRPSVLEELPTSDELNQYVEQRLRENPPPTLPSLSPGEELLLHQALSPIEDDAAGMIAESIRWVQKISREDPNIRSGIRRALESLITTPQPLNNAGQAKYHERDGYTIQYACFPDRKYWFLLDYFTSGSARRIREEHNAQSHEELLRESARLYPAYLVLEDPEWQKIEDSRDANLALSPEEIDVLNNVARAHMNEPAKAFPLFINGRPGSGKSTLLYYLFAAYLRFFNEHKGDFAEGAIPVFLTYSESLLKKAKEVVKEIYLHGQQGNDGMPRDLPPDYSRFFKQFRQLMLELLPPEEQRHFEPENHVDFLRFKRWMESEAAFTYANNQRIRSLTPELGWHVIRSYIKGMQQDAGDYMDPEYYKFEIPDRDKSVSVDTFELVYNEVWKRYLKETEQNQLWDDQDLARKILDLSQEQGQAFQQNIARFPVIICDESQDFTKIELEVISRLSLYFNRDKNAIINYLHRIPIAFAGDPFQTLNPTGFKWETTKSIFYETVARSLDARGARNLDINYKELRYNYRSTKHIVQFCNLIQLIRGDRFHITGLLPQKTWHLTEAHMPVFFSENEDVAREGLRQAETATIIIPCNEGEEEEYVQSDTFLRELAWDEENKKVTRDILSAMTAKGLEFERVVLYKFGDYYVRHNLDQLYEGEHENREKLLPLEYFFNKLYVGASRGQKRVIILDSRSGQNQFWHRFQDGEFIESLRKQYNSEMPAAIHEKWDSEDITTIAHGTEEDWTGQFDTDLLEKARQFFEQGKATGNIYLLRRAASIFHEQMEYTQEKEALAQIHLIRKEYKEAGDLYVELAKYDKALKWYWEGRAFKAIIKLKDRDASFANRLEWQIAACIERNEPSPPQMLITLHERIDDIATSKKIWKETIQDILENTLIRDIDEEDREKLCLAIESLDQNGYVEASQDLAGFIYQKLGNAPLASKMLHKIGITAGTASQTLYNWIHEVFAMVAPWPDRAVHLYILGKTDELIDLYKRNQDFPLTDTTLQYVLGAFLKEYGFDYEKIPVGLRETYILHLLIDKGLQEKEDAADAILALLKHYMQENLYRAGARLASKLEVKYRNEWQFLTAPIDRLWLLKQFIDEIGNSTSIHQAELRELSGIEEFLKEVLDYLSDPIGVEEKLLLEDGRRGEFFFEDPRIIERMIQQVGIRNLGRAFENVGRHRLSAKFYQIVLKKKWYRDENEEWFARKRWAKNMQKLIAHIKESKNGAAARILEMRLEETLDKWKMGLEEIANEPDLPEWHAYEEHDKEESSEETPVKPRDITAPLATNGTNAQDLKEAPQEKEVSDEEVVARTPLSPARVRFELPETGLRGEILYHQKRWRLKDEYDNECTLYAKSSEPPRIDGELSLNEVKPDEWHIPEWRVIIKKRTPRSRRGRIAFQIKDDKDGILRFAFLL